MAFARGLPGDRAPARGLAPGPPLRGAARVPGSKSIAQRALLAAGLAGGTSRLRGSLAGDDVAATRAWLQALGIGVSEDGAGLAVAGGGAVLPPRPTPLAAGESGTLARAATALLALCGTPGAEYRLQAAGSLRRRSHPALLAALGPRVLDGGWPTVLRAAPPDGPLVLREATSSQELTALLLALAARPEGGVVRVVGAIPSAPYVDLTAHVLARFGASVVRESRGAETTFEVRGSLVAAELEIEADASLAAVALAAGCLSGGEVTIPGLDRGSPQGDARIVERLAAFGCRARWSPGGPVCGGKPPRGAELDLRDEPDLAPVLAAVAAAAANAGCTTRLGGLDTLPGKESSRIAVLVEGLRACGWRARGDERSLEVAAGPPAGAEPVTLDPAGDHRMAFAFALLGLSRPGVRVGDPGCTAKSWPGFWDSLAELGARVV